MNLRRIPLLLVPLLLACAAPAARAQAPGAADDAARARILRAVQSTLDEARAALKLPGATVGFALPGGLSASASTGLADVETKAPLRPTDRMPAGSVGKTFVAALALKLAEEGRLDLDEKVSRRLGGERWFARLPNAADLTLRMLLNHSSGIPNHVELGGFMNRLFKDSSRDIKYEELLAYVLDKKPLFPAGRGHHYGDTNYILAGMVLERAAGRTLYEEVGARFLKPLGLERTIPSNSHVLPEVANGYFEGKPVIVGGRFRINPQWEWAGGGFASTAEDLARWARALYGGDVLSKKSLEEMFGSTTVGEGAGYGLGVEVGRGKLGTTYGHDGEFPGYLSDVRYFPKYGLAVAVQVNADESEAASRFASTAVEDFAQLVVRELSGRSLAADERESARAAAEAWLGLVDAGRLAESGESLSSELKVKYPGAKWEAVLRPFRSQVGKLKTRRFRGADYADPEAGTVAVDFASSFAKGDATSETVTLKREAGGWRVAGYTIR
jgi:D-alanyl-D-alanine carboxypeptidase